MKDKNAALAASLLSCYPRESGNTVSLCAFTAAVCPDSPSPLLMHRTTQSQIYATFRPGASGCVRVYPDSFSLYNSKTYVACPGRPGKNQHIAHARARVFRLLFSDLLFILLLKTPGQPGQLLKIHYLHPDSRPDAPGQPGRIIIGGLLCR